MDDEKILNKLRELRAKDPDFSKGRVFSAVSSPPKLHLMRLRFLQIQTPLTSIYFQRPGNLNANVYRGSVIYFTTLKPRAT